MVYLGNAFSLQMIVGLLSDTVLFAVSKVCPAEVAAANFISVVGHADTAAVVGNLLGKEVAFNRANLSLNPGDILYVAQVTGGRLPEGATKLPEGFKMEFLKVEIKKGA